MPIDKLRRRPSTDTPPTSSPGEWKWFQFFGDRLAFNTDAGVVKYAVTTADNEVKTAATTLTAADSGKIFFLNSGTEFATTLPAPVQGWHATFIVTAAPSGASYTIVTPGSPDQILAGSVFVCADAAGDAESAATGTTITFVNGQAVVGDMCDIYSDGTSFFARCFAAVAAGITITG